MSRDEIREILRHHRGKAKRVANLAGVKPAAFSMWLHGKSPSARLDIEVPSIIRRLKLKAKKTEGGAA